MENRKKESGLRRMSNTERKKQILPPCRVCRSPGAGCHYGVVTCGGCKGFFHRALQYHTQYKCEGNERCDITNAKGKLCQRCRYQACLAVGMSKDAIRTGRYTLKERTKYILEIKGLLNGKQPSKRNASYKAGNKASTQFQNDFYETLYKSPTASYTEPHPSQAIQMPTISSLVSPDPRDTRQNPILSATIGHNKNVHYGTRLSIEHHSEADSFDLSNEDTKSNSSADVYHQNIHQFFDSSLSPEEQKFIIDLYSNDTVVLMNLMDSHERHLGYVRREKLNTNLLEETELHYEICKHEALLSEKSQQDEKCFMTEGTGLTSTVSDHFFADYGDGVELFTRKMVCFIKNVPGFSNLDMSDKIDLIKCGRLEFAFLSHFDLVNYDLSVVYEYSNQRWICPYDLIRYNHEDTIPMMKDYIKLSQKLKDINLSEEEIVVLKAMAILCPDRVKTKNTAVIQEIYWRLAQLLISLLSKRHTRPQLIFAKIVDIVTEFRKAEFEINNFILNLNLKQKDMDDKPLTKEMLTGLVFPRGDL